MGRLLVVMLLAAALLLVVVALVVAAAGGPVSRVRLERFARRQRLTITPGNGNQVIRYLATTRRWRVAGFVVGIAGSQVVRPDGAIIHVNSVLLFVGWFLGALIAEVRLAHLEFGSIRAASLQPRRPRRYVRGIAWALVPATAVVSVLTAAATAAADLMGSADPDWDLAGSLLVVALVAAGLVRWIQHRVLDRAQPLAAPDVIEADDAIRSRSLHVLSGGGAAVVLIIVLNQLPAVHPAGPVAEQAIEAIRFLGIFAVALFGWLVATSIWPPPGTAARTPNPSVGTSS